VSQNVVVHMSDIHRVYLECVHPEIGKKGMNKFYQIDRYGNEVSIRYGSIGEKNFEGRPISAQKVETKTFRTSREAEAFLIKQMRSKTNPKGKTMKDTSYDPPRTIPKPPYKVLFDEVGGFDIRAIRGKKGVINFTMFNDDFI